MANLRLREAVRGSSASSCTLSRSSSSPSTRESSSSSSQSTDRRSQDMAVETAAKRRRPHKRPSTATSRSSSASSSCRRGTKKRAGQPPPLPPPAAVMRGAALPPLPKIVRPASPGFEAFSGIASLSELRKRSVFRTSPGPTTATSSDFSGKKRSAAVAFGGGASAMASSSSSIQKQQHQQGKRRAVAPASGSSDSEAAEDLALKRRNEQLLAMIAQFMEVESARRQEEAQRAQRAAQASLERALQDFSKSHEKDRGLIVSHAESSIKAITKELAALDAKAKDLASNLFLLLKEFDEETSEALGNLREDLLLKIKRGHKGAGDARSSSSTTSKGVPQRRESADPTATLLSQIQGLLANSR